MKAIKMIMYISIIATSILLGSYYYYLIPIHQAPVVACAVVYPTAKNKVEGTVHFTATSKGTHITANITGLSPGKHGFHVHEYGYCSSSDALCTGDHFNPTNAPHGSPTDKHSHVGDLGNIIADEHGNGYYEELNTKITLFGPHSVIGRSVIIHEQPDDLKSQPTGNSGKRIGYGVIGIK